MWTKWYLITETRLRMIMGRQRWRATEWQTTNKVVSERRGVRNSTILHFYKFRSPQIYILQSCSSTSPQAANPRVHYSTFYNYNICARVYDAVWCHLPGANICKYTNGAETAARAQNEQIQKYKRETTRQQRELVICILAYHCQLVTTSCIYFDWDNSHHLPTWWSST